MKHPHFLKIKGSYPFYIHGNEAVAIFVQFEAGLAGHFHLHLGLLVFGVGFSLLFNVGAGSGETRGDDFGWLVVFLWSGGSEGSSGRL